MFCFSLARFQLSRTSFSVSVLLLVSLTPSVPPDLFARLLLQILFLLGLKPSLAASFFVVFIPLPLQGEWLPIEAKDSPAIRTVLGFANLLLGTLQGQSTLIKWTGILRGITVSHRRTFDAVCRYHRDRWSRRTTHCLAWLLPK